MRILFVGVWAVALIGLVGCPKEPTAEGADAESAAPDAGSVAPVPPDETPPVVEGAGPPPQGETKDGLKVGPWVFFHANGKKAAEGEYRDGDKNGHWTYWYDNGQKTAEGEYRAGEMHGRWTEWDEAGAVVSERTYEEGREVFK